ncbi:hypothetical protein [Bartonella sp. MR90HLJMH]|uniref:hypothetical protein n=1 Tax=Bartonella sp. MR90HLJMH TaxID=3243559 RepID=UPI0035D04969
MGAVDLGSVLGFQNGGIALEKGNNDISQGTSSLLCTLGVLVLRADVNIWQLSHKSFMEGESLGFEKKYRKNLFGPAFLVVQIVIKTKQLRYDFLALVCFFFEKKLISWK